MSTKKRNITFSNLIASRLGLKLADREYYYGPGIGSADNYCKIKNKLIVFEIEYRQRHPEFNVSKIWPFIEKNRDIKVLLIHYITNTKEVSSNRIIFSEWIARKMKKDLKERFDYYLIKNEITEFDLIELKSKISKI